MYTQTHKSGVNRGKTFTDTISRKEISVIKAGKIEDNRPESAIQRKLQRMADSSPLMVQQFMITNSPANQTAPVQRRIQNPKDEAEIMGRTKKYHERRSQAEKMIAPPKFDVDATEVYKEKSGKQQNELAKTYEDIIKFEQSFLYGADIKPTDEDKKKITNAEYWIDDGLKTVNEKMQSFWRKAQKAHGIRSTLRKGAEKFRTNSSASIPELYAGTVEDANEIMAGKSTFAKIINDKSWFTDTSGSAFVKHAMSRSAKLGYSPAGEGNIMLHIGHRNKK